MKEPIWAEYARMTQRQEPHWLVGCDQMRINGFPRSVILVALAGFLAGSAAFGQPLDLIRRGTPFNPYQPTPRTAPAPTPLPPLKASPEQIEQWVRNLSSHKFIEREKATINLIRVGSPGIDLVANATRQLKSEGVLRGIHVLKSIGIRGEFSAREKAHSALALLAKETQPSISRRAIAALAVVDSQRQDRAIRDLIAMGASIDVRTSRFNQQYVRMLTVRIDESWKGTDVDLARLRWLANVEQVELRGKKVKDSWFSHLRSMKSLRALSIRDAQITDKALENAGGLKSLQYLDIRYSPVSGQTAKRIIQLNSLSTISLYGTRVTPEMASEIQTALKRAQLDYRKGAFLGIGCPSPPLPCVVNTVQENTAAEKAGLKPDDVIVKVDKTNIGTFDDLRGAIGAKMVGDTATVDLIRPGPRRFAAAVYQAGQAIGIDGERGALGVRIKKVAPGSLADKMGLKPNDFVRSVIGATVYGPKELDDYIKQVGVNARINIEYSREHKRLTKKVVFGRWNSDD